MKLRRISVGMAIIVLFLISRHILLNCIALNSKTEEKKHSIKLTDQKLFMLLQHPHSKHYILNPHVTYSQAHQDETVYDILQKENGFFIEIGAYNGIQFSNTLWLERMHNWTGLLVEANPSLCSRIDKLKRHVWRLCSCISTEDQVTFVIGGGMGGVKNNIDRDHMKALHNNQEITVPCFTLMQVLKKINVYKIDYFSLDVEGAELFILNTIKRQLLEEHIIIGVWTIEYRVFDGRNIIFNQSIINLQKLRDFFKELPQYLEHSQLHEYSSSNVVPDGHALDVVFVHISVWCERHKVLPNKTDCPYG